MGSSCDSPEVEAQGVTQFVGTQELDSLVGRKASKPICFSPSRIPFFRVSPCCDRRSQLTRGAFLVSNSASFAFGRPRLSAYSLPSIGPTCGGSLSRYGRPIPNSLPCGSIHFHEFSLELHRCAMSASVKQRRTQHEHMFSALRSNSDIA